MNVIDEERFAQVCEGVWRDRAAILFWCGSLSGEDALMRAVYWRLCKVGDKPEQSFNDYAPLLKNLLRRYRDEATPRGE
jgi:hypothetical protein